MKRINLVFIAILTGHAMAQDADVRFRWRSYLTPEQWKLFDGELSTYNRMSVSAAEGREACGLPRDDSSDFHFTDVLVKQRLLRTGAEVDDQRKKYDAWYDLRRIIHLSVKCDPKDLAETEGARHAYLMHMIDFQVKGGLQGLRGGKVYR